MDCSPLGSSVRRVFQARILERVALSFFRWSSQPRNWTQVSCFADRFLTTWATREAQCIKPVHGLQRKLFCMDTCICMAESLHYTPETITTLLISYAPIQNVIGVNINKSINIFLEKENYSATNSSTSKGRQTWFSHAVPNSTSRTPPMPNNPEKENVPPLGSVWAIAWEDDREFISALSHLKPQAFW